MAEEASSVPNNKKSNNISVPFPVTPTSNSLRAIDRKGPVGHHVHITWYPPFQLSSFFACSYHTAYSSPPDPTFTQIPSTKPLSCILLTYKFSLPKSPPKQKLAKSSASSASPRLNRNSLNLNHQSELWTWSPLFYGEDTRKALLPNNTWWYLSRTTSRLDFAELSRFHRHTSR
jgi:hypothetical protein